MTRDSAWRRLPLDAPPAVPGPLDPAEIVAFGVPPNGGVPNNPRLDALVYPGALVADHATQRVKALFERHRWFRVWDWTIARTPLPLTDPLYGPDGPLRSIWGGRPD